MNKYWLDSLTHNRNKGTSIGTDIVNILDPTNICGEYRHTGSPYNNNTLDA